MNNNIEQHNPSPRSCNEISTKKDRLSAIIGNSRDNWTLQELSSGVVHTKKKLL
jgi:hypothetical protein